MTIRLNGSTSGYVEIDAPAVAGNTTVTLPSISGTMQLVPGVWSSATPTISGTGWAIGNGNASTRFIQVGKTVSFTTTITFGSTSTFGGGWMSVSLPVTPLDNGSVTGIAYANDLSTGANYIGALVSGIYPLWITSAAGNLDGTISTRPMTWANGDILRILATYEAV
jgi:hypothetical protein